MSDERICNCGSIDDAINVAERLYVDSLASECRVWALQVATAYQCLASRSLLADIPAEYVIAAVSQVARQTNANARADEDLVEEAAQKMRGLN